MLSELRGAASVPSSIPLQRLSLTTAHNLPKDFLSPLLHSATQLTSLALSFHNGVSINPSLSSVAPRLLHLTLDSVHFNTSALIDFVAKCKNLVTLRCKWTGAQRIHDLLDNAQCKLLLLETVGVPGPSTEAYGHLMSALQLPALSSLRRWQLTWLGDDEDERDWKAWVAACGAQAVEARDHRRYFTGESRARCSFLAAQLNPSFTLSD